MGYLMALLAFSCLSRTSTCSRRTDRQTYTLWEHTHSVAQ